MSEARLRLYRRRQSRVQWLGDYQPAIKATPKEAPSMSRPTILTPQKLQGREMHLLSLPEAAAALLALYSPAVFDIHEQKVLSTTPDLHPLFWHPLAAGLELPSLRGTVNVADALGLLARHPKIFVNDRRSDVGTWVPFPYVGDLLLFLQDQAGPYCVNWTVKTNSEGFRQRGPQLLHRPRDDTPDPKAIARHLIEEQYYQDAGIRTVQVTGAAINADVNHNLYELFLWHRRPVATASDTRKEVVDFFKGHLGGMTVLHELVLVVQRKYDLTRDDVLALLKQAIWRRELCVDLYQPILMDRPLRRATRDVLTDYAAWFARAP